MNKRQYNFNVNVKAKTTFLESESNVIIQGDVLKIKSYNETSCTINKIKDFSGEYNIKDIKSISYSTRFIGLTPMIFTLLVLMAIIMIFSQIKEMVLAFLIILGTVYIFSRVKTIKISFKGNKNIHIPIAQLFESLEIKEDVQEFMNGILQKIR